jgi:cytochrome b pre-mRNA-processing protein 3
LSLLSRLLGGEKERERLAPLYAALVAAGRAPAWYREGGVPDTIEGRFDMIASLLALALVRLDAEGEEGRRESALLTEAFIDDMDASLRQIGIGDFVVGKHVGKLVGALGGRLDAYSAALQGKGDLEEAVRRNIFRDSPPSTEAVAFVAGGLRRFASDLDELSLEQMLAGDLPAP